MIDITEFTGILVQMCEWIYGIYWDCCMKGANDLNI